MTLASEMIRVTNTGQSLVGVETLDPIGAEAEIAGTNKTVNVRWDCTHGFRGVTPADEPQAKALMDAAMQGLMQGMPPPVQGENPDWIVFDSLITNLRVLRPSTRIFMHQPAEWWKMNTFKAMVHGFRDHGKRHQQQLVFVGTSIGAPPGIADDITVLEHPLPTAEELRALAENMAECAKVKLKDDEADRAANLCLGTGKYPAETNLCYALTRKGYDFRALAERRAATVKGYRGLEMCLPGITFDDIGGLDPVKAFMDKLVAHNQDICGFIWMDEFDRGAATAQDSNGIAQDQTSVLLQVLADNQWPGVMFMGQPGCLHGQTRIYDPVDNSDLTVYERYMKGVSFHVLSEHNGMAVVATALPPCRYSESDMIEFELDNGNAITVTPFHRFLMSNGDYMYAQAVCDLLQSGVPCQLRTILDSDLSTRQPGAGRCFETVQDFPVDYPECHHCDGEQLHLEEGIFQEILQQQGDAPRRSRAQSQMDAQAGRHTNIPCKNCDRHATPGSCLLTQTYKMDEHPPLPGEGLCTRDVHWNQQWKQLLPLLARSCTTRPPVSCDSASIWPSELSMNVSVIQVHDTRILRCRPKCKSVFYDFHVPVHNNYYAEGAFHHNCGKSEICKALAGQFDKPCLRIDFNAAQSKWVGETGEFTRMAFKVARGMSQGRKMLVVATANMNHPEQVDDALLSRFPWQWFFDFVPGDMLLPIWVAQMKRHGLDEQPLPNCEGWSGRDIYNCCAAAKWTGVSLVDAAKLIISESLRASQLADRRRKHATGRCLDANYPGVYDMNRVLQSSQRKVNV